MKASKKKNPSRAHFGADFDFVMEYKRTAETRCSQYRQSESSDLGLELDVATELEPSKPRDSSSRQQERSSSPDLRLKLNATAELNVVQD